MKVRIAWGLFCAAVIAAVVAGLDGNDEAVMAAAVVAFLAVALIPIGEKQ